MKTAQKRHWDRVADGWAAWLGWTEQNFRPLTAWCADAGGWTARARVADVACGAGYPALAAATCVASGGVVSGCDISRQMTSAAARGARARGIDNVTFHTMDAEHLAWGDETFDSVCNTYGLMFCPDAVRALHEAWRVLRPGGHLTIATWDEPDKSPFFTVITGVGVELLSLAPLEPAAPGPFRFSSPTVLAGMLRAAGFGHIDVESRSMTFECASVGDYCRLFGDVAWSARMAALSPAERARFEQSVGRVAQPYRDGDKLYLAATSLCASARKP